jgi:DNA gyrase inhibitor GyrI
MTRKKMIYLSVAIVVIALAYFGWKQTARSAYEAAEYTVLEADSPFEIREYPELTMATTNMQFAAQGDDGSFMRLFDYISGENDQEQKVAMTVPVFMEPADQDDQGQMGFVIPKNVTAQRVPEPSSDDVQIRKRAGGKFAVMRFAGRINSQSVAQAEEKLRAWMNDKGLTGNGDTEFAGYDPPWTPGPLRRNEVLIRVK